MYISAGPCLPGAIRLRRVWFILHLHPFQPSCSMFHAVCCILSPVSLQLVVVVFPGTDILPPPDCCASAWGVSDETLEFIKIPSNLQYLPKSSKWIPETSKRQQNGVQSGP